MPNFSGFPICSHVSEFEFEFEVAVYMYKLIRSDPKYIDLQPALPANSS